jgi:hypothetical protein
MQKLVLEDVDTNNYSDFEEEDGEFHDGEYYDGSSIDATESTEWCPLPLPGQRKHLVELPNELILQIASYMSEKTIFRFGMAFPRIMMLRPELLKKVDIDTRLACGLVEFDELLAFLFKFPWFAEDIKSIEYLHNPVWEGQAAASLLDDSLIASLARRVGLPCGSGSYAQPNSENLAFKLSLLLALARELEEVEITPEEGHHQTYCIALAPAIRLMRSQGRKLHSVRINLGHWMRPQIRRHEHLPTVLRCVAGVPSDCLQINEAHEYALESEVPMLTTTRSSVSHLCFSGTQGFVRPQTLLSLLSTFSHLTTFDFTILWTHVMISDLGYGVFRRALIGFKDTLQNLRLDISTEMCEGWPEWEVASFGSLKEFSKLKRLEISSLVLWQRHYGVDDEDTVFEDVIHDRKLEAYMKFFTPGEMHQFRTYVEDLSPREEHMFLIDILPSSLHSLLLTRIDEDKLIDFLRALPNLKEEMFPYLTHLIDVSGDWHYTDINSARAILRRALIRVLIRVGVDFYAEDRHDYTNDEGYSINRTTERKRYRFNLVEDVTDPPLLCMGEC